ncbi:TonB-dependent receptor [Pseudomonas sp. F1_0610]|uniref:TonB-dependent receptor domain-containing protein n=1 Tax=Pseudomonas sp. F1_0610 TaxID=3114284 RepID=UPI0039C48B88
MLTFFQRSVLATAVLGLSAASQANTGSKDPLQLNNVVVSAAGFEQKITDAPASISVISQEQLQRKRVTSIADALSDIEGVDVNDNAGKTGGLNISIRGMDPKYTLILIDGRRQNVAGNVTPNGFGETSTSFIPPVSQIERIEVIRGPMSTLYGSDAMGGVVNIITKKINNEWGGAVTAETTLQEKREFGDSRQINAYLSGPLIEDKLGLTLSGNYFERDKSEIEYRKVNGEIVQPAMGRNPVKSDKYNIGSKLVFTPSDDQMLGLEIRQDRQTYDNHKGQLGTLGDGGYTKEQRYERDQYTVFYEGNFNIGLLEASLMQNNTETFGRTNPALIKTPGIIPLGKRKLREEDTIFNIKLLSQLGDHNLTHGAQIHKAKMEDGVVSSPFRHRIYSAFIEDEWRFIPSMALTLGGRVDHHDKFGTEISPRAYLVWNLNDQWTLKGGASKGFKAPELQQLSDGINGFGRQGRLPLVGNPDLKPETTISSEIGVYFDNLSNFNANATVFHNSFEDKIGETIVNNCRVINSANCIDIGPGYNKVAPTFFKEVNIDKATTKGIELAGRYQFAPNWSLLANYTYTKTEQKSGADKGWPLSRTPKHMLNTSLNWQTTDKLATWLKAEYRSKRFRRTAASHNYAYEALGDYKAYTLFHLGGSYQATDNLAINATIYNLLDKNFIKYKSYTSNADGAIAYDNQYNNSQERRRLWLSATYTF